MNKDNLFFQTKAEVAKSVQATCDYLTDYALSLDYTIDGNTRALYVMRFEFGEIDFERKSDWLRFVNKLNNYDDTPIKRKITGDKKSVDWGFLEIARTDIEYTEDGFLITYKEPTDIIVGSVGDSYIIYKATKLKGKISWEWSHITKGHEVLGNYAGVCDVYIHNIEIIE